MFKSIFRFVLFEVTLILNVGIVVESPTNVDVDSNPKSFFFLFGAPWIKDGAILKVFLRFIIVFLVIFFLKLYSLSVGTIVPPSSIISTTYTGEKGEVTYPSEPLEYFSSPFATAF